MQFLNYLTLNTDLKPLKNIWYDQYDLKDDSQNKVYKLIS